MSKCAAKIKIGWVNKCFEADSPGEIIQQVSEYQDFNCLLRMGRLQEGKKGQKELDKLEAFLNKWFDESLTMEDIKNLNIHLSIGDIVCHGIAENEEAVKALKEEA